MGGGLGATPYPMPYVYQKNAAGHYVCPHCGVTKERQNTMHYHLKKHEGRLPFECEHCNKEFLQASTLALHIAARHPDVAKAAADAAKSYANADRVPLLYSCPDCPQTSLTKANSVLHYLRKHCADEVKVFQNQSTHSLTCAACQKVCNSSTAYLYHVASAGCLTAHLPAEKGRALEGLFGARAAGAATLHAS